MEQKTFYEMPVKEIHLDLYADESKNRKYKNCSVEETIDYIMIMAVPVNKKEELYRKISNSRCLSGMNSTFESCNLKCKYHEEDNGEIHYTKIKKENIKFKISNKWLDILLNNNFKNENSIYFNILGVVESNLDMQLFGERSQYGNIYTRFFRTALLRLVTMFNNYDKIVIEHIYHDSTVEMEHHKYFNTNAIKQIRLKQLAEEKDKIKFNTEKIEFIDSDHRISNSRDSQFIQFVDLILGLTCNVIHNDAENEAKRKLTEKIYPLVSHILDKRQYMNKNSKYNYFNKQSISFFPCISRENLKLQCDKMYGNNIEIDKLLKNKNFFSNSKELLFKLDDTQLTLF